ncbi:MAG: ubiquinone/menaquinone biosynthesis methyltransferase [Acidobacteria bacterium]|nr:ubiquinone/menaquinone biosynthesis methyltransferase [Acidobacteriota bacterium]
MTTPEHDETHDRAVRDMFQDIAPVYDRMNQIMTLGRVRAWRKELVQGLKLKSGQCVLDLATGTGDIAFEMLRQQPDLQVWATDFSVNMMQLGRKRTGADKMHWVSADAHLLPFKNESFDAVSCGFLLRNASDRKQVIGEIYRVLKPGGVFASLDTMPPAGPFKPMIWLACRVAVPVISSVLTRRKDAYQYLGDSTLGFVSPVQIEHEMQAQGFEKCGHLTRWFRSIAIVRGIKPS